MLKFITPLFLIVLSGGLFFSYIDPTYNETGNLKKQQTEYDDALTKSKELREIRQQLLTKYNIFLESDIKRLDKLLPNTVDNVRLIMEINQIAVKNGCSIRSIDVNSVTSGDDKSGNLGPNLDGYESIGLSFSVDAKYDDFVNFMDDLGNSLRIVDVVEYAIKAATGDVFKHEVSVKTYWLK